MGRPIPTLAAALVCQTIITDESTKARTLVNVSHGFNVPLVPAQIALSLYIKMIDGEGAYELVIKLVKMSDDITLIKTPPIQIEWRIENAPVDIATSPAVYPVPGEGMYEFQIFMDDIYIGRVAFLVSVVLPPQMPEQESAT